MTDQAVLDKLDRIAELLAAALERPALAAPESPKTAPKTGDGAGPGKTAPVARSSPVARATGHATGEKKQRRRVVDAAKTPRDYVLEYLDDHPDQGRQVGQPDALGYRDLAALIGARYGMDFDHSTVYRAVKKWRG